MRLTRRDGKPYVEERGDYARPSYDWASLATMPLASGSGPKTLQDYWRINPSTGRARSDATLRSRGELVRIAGREWLIYHLVPKQLEILPEIRRARIAALKSTGILARLARATPFDDDLPAFGDEIPRGDGRAQLAGVSLHGVDLSSIGRIDACFDNAIFNECEFGIGAVFGPFTSFENALFLDDAQFRSSSFENVKFRHTVFYSRTSFRSCKFSGRTDFSGAHFELTADFEDATFERVAFFTGSMFVKNSSFMSVKFNSVDFVDVAFVNKTNFSDAIFIEPSAFTRSYFGGESSFASVRFADHTTFQESVFAGGIDSYEGSAIEDRRSLYDVSFIGASFGSSADFSDCCFRSPVSFQAARFGHFAQFVRARFDGTANFAAGSFGRRLSFASAIFSGYASFLGVEADSDPPTKFDLEAPKQPSDANSANFLASDFSRAAFHADADFQNRTFAEAVTFEASVWAGVPLFHGATFRDDVSFEQARYPSVYRTAWPSLNRGFGEDWRADWPARGQAETGWTTEIAYSEARQSRLKNGLPPLERRGPVRWAAELLLRYRKPDESSPFVDMSELDDRYAALERGFRSLSEKMKALGSQRASITFFKHQQRARRRRTNRREVGWGEIFLSQTYDFVSDYGDSLWRPLAGWLLTTGVAIAGVWWFAAHSSDITLSTNTLEYAAQYVLQNAFKPFDVWTTPLPRPLHSASAPVNFYSDWIRAFLNESAIGGRLVLSAYSVTNLTLLFLFGLAVRRRMSV